MGKKKSQAAFVSGYGRHSPRSIGNDLGFDDFAKHKKLDGESHSKLHDTGQKWADLLTGVGLKTGEKIAITAVGTIVDKFIDNLNQNTFLTHQNKISSLGKNEAIYLKTVAHIGIPTSKRLRRMSLNNPMVSFTEKKIASSSKDYQNHSKRKNLVLNSGFEQKTFSFFMEDTYFRTKDWLNLYQSDPKITKNLKRIKNGRTDVYGCVYYSRLQLKFANHFDYYSVVCRLHLIKIHDIHEDYRGLIEDITNNKTNVNPIIKPDTETEPKEDKEKGKTNIRGNIKETVKKLGEEVASDLIDKSNINKEWKELLKDKIKNKGTLRGHPYGKIPEDKQYSDPVTTDKTNKYSINLITSLNCQLTDSVQFRDRAKIVKTWYHVLGPQSIWEFNLTTHYGKGIHLNYIFDLEDLNMDHPSGYVLALEFNGDARSKLIRRSDGDTFLGISPSRIHCEFNHTLGFLVEEKDGFDDEDGKPTVYRSKKTQEDFEEGSEFQKLFTPDREPTFNVNFEDIEFLETKSNQDGEEKEYILEYDTVLSTSDNLLKKIKTRFSDQGLDSEDITFNDEFFNVTNKESVEDYEGTGEYQDLDENDSTLDDIL